MSWETEPFDKLQELMRAEKVEADLLGITLTTTDGGAVYIPAEAIDHLSMIMHAVKGAALRELTKKLRAERDRTY